MWIKICACVIILVVFSQAHIIQNKKNDFCAAHGSLCDPSLNKPCCQDDNYCLSQWPETYFCVYNALLLGYCQHNLDCTNIENAICLENKCVCNEYYIAFNSTECRAEIDHFCYSEDGCATDGAICVDERCKCRQGHFLLNNKKCVPIYLKQSCVTDRDCFDENRVHCSEDKLCICKKNSVVRYGMEICESLVGGFCDRDSDCFIINSVCVENECKCKKMYKAMSNYECKLSYVGEDCEVDSDCIDSNRAMCSKALKCSCMKNHTAVTDGTCMSLMGGYCWRDKDCIIYNSVCILDRCQCRQNAKLVNNNCVREFLDKSCSRNEDCKEINYSECSNGLCICKENHIAMDGKACASLLDGVCTDSRECVIENSACVTHNCQCKDGFERNSESHCSPAVWKTPCQANADCAIFGQSECSKNNTYFRKRNYTAGNGLRCATSIGGNCTDAGDCAPFNSDCIENKCQCKDGFVAQLGIKCLPTSLGKPCEEDMDCKNTNHAKCRKDGICDCRDNNIAVKNTFCEPLLGAFCWQNEKCAPDNSICVNDECRCKPFFTPQSNDRCVRLPLGKPCAYDIDCIYLNHLECSRLRKCVCRRTYKNINETECKPYLNGNCLYDDDCIPYNSQCIHGKCRCKIGFSSTNNYECLPIALIPKVCNTNFDCSNMGHSVCNEFKVCECIKKYTNVNGKCMPL